MAFAPVNYSASPFEVIDITTKDFAIGGKLVAAKCSISDLQASAMDMDIIKEKLMYQLISFIMENKLVEFTKIPDLYSGGSTYIARCYVAPDEMVKVLRIHSK